MISLQILPVVGILLAFTGAPVFASDTPATLRVLKKGETVYMRNHFSADQDLVVILKKGRNGEVDFNRAILVPHSDDMTEAKLTEGTVVHNKVDSATPWALNGTYIGANHGCSSVLEVTSHAHGMQTVDIGSEWLDAANKRFYLIKIVDNDKLWFLPENIGKQPIWKFSPKPTGDSLHRNSDNASVKIEKSVGEQLTPSLHILKREYLVDGKTPLVDDIPVNCEFLEIIDQNEIVNPGTVLAEILKHPGTEPNFIAPDLDAILRNDIKFTFYPNGTTLVDTRVKTLEPFDLMYMGFVQSGKLMKGDTDLLEYYVPKTLPFDFGGTHYDFESIQDVSNGIPQPLQLNPGQKNLADLHNLPDRFIQFLSRNENGKTVRKLGFVTGYSLIVGMTVPQERSKFTTSAGFIHSSSKVYPSAMDTKLQNPIPAGSEFHCLAYHQYFNPAEQKDATAFYWHKEGDSYVVYADYHQPVRQGILQLPAFMAGKKVSVVEKTDSITLSPAESVPTKGLTLNVAGNYGYVVLRVQ